ncbi:DUF2271 domain-containing protein [Pirellulaceae bacterium SH449]
MSNHFYVGFLAVCCISVGRPLEAEVFRFSREHVLGTSLEWTVEIADRDSAVRTEQTVLEEIARWDKVFSRYRSDSVLSRWARGEISDETLPDELVMALQFAENTRVGSSGAFDIRVTRLQELWNKAVSNGVAPSLIERREIAETFLKTPYRIHDGKLQSEGQLGNITLDAFAKGFILDRVCDRIAKTFPEARSFCINIGGDLRKSGSSPMRFSIDHPFLSAEQGVPLISWKTELPLAIATSGGYRRFVKLADQRISHIFDPRTGLPADSLASVTVVAPDAMRADAYATVVSVLGCEDGLKWIEQQSGTACLIVDNQGGLFVSERWEELTGDEVRNGSFDKQGERLIAFKDKEEGPGLHIQFELARVGGGGYRRPYVAIWLEDEENFPVKTALLWMQTEQPGPRWHRDLTRWYRNDRVRKLSEKVDLIETIAGATRGPGEYRAHFDGTDNSGKPLKTGKYMLFFEVARENGTYQLLKQPIQWNSEEFEIQDWGSNVEVAKASIRFIPNKSAD